MPSNRFNIYFYLFIWLHKVLVVALKIFNALCGIFRHSVQASVMTQELSCSESIGLVTDSKLTLL